MGKNTNQRLTQYLEITKRNNHNHPRRTQNYKPRRLPTTPQSNRKRQSKMTTHNITTHYEHGFWMINIPHLDGITQAETWEIIPQMAKEYIHLATNTPTEQIDINITEIKIGESTLISDALTARKQAQQAEQTSKTLTINALQLMKTNGLPLREIGKVLNISHQRASQLLKNHH